MIKIFFVRHAQPEHGWEDDRSRPLTLEGERLTHSIEHIHVEKEFNLMSK